MNRRACLAHIASAALCSLSPVSSLLAAEPSAVVQELEPFIEKHRLAGAVALVGDQDKILSLEAVGLADIQSSRPMQVDGLFWVASLTKPMTSTAVMTLVDEGRILLEDPIEKYLPEFKGQMVIAARDQEHVLLKPPSRSITIRDLLRHTSGMLYKTPIQTPTLDQFPLDIRVKSSAMLPLQFDPGSKYLYSSAGINTAGRIIEIVTGQKYEDFMAHRLFEPLEMKDSTFWPTAEQLKRLPTSYEPSPDGQSLQPITIWQTKYPLDDHTRQPIPGSGLFTTATDLSHFCQMMLNNGTWNGRRIVSEKSVREMTRVQTSPGMPSYGLAWEIYKKPAGAFGHGGSYHTFFRIYPEQRRVAVLLMQHFNWKHGEGEKIYSAFRSVVEAEFSGRP